MTKLRIVFAAVALLFGASRAFAQTPIGNPKDPVWSGSGAGSVIAILKSIAAAKVCTGYAFYDASTSGDTQMIPLNGSKVTYICGVKVSLGGTATNVNLDYGTGSNCATSPTAFTPVWQLPASGQTGFWSAFWTGMTAPSGKAVCVKTSGANPVQVEVSYVQQ